MAGSVDFSYVANLPDNLVSSSAQVDEFDNGLLVQGGNLKLAGAISLELSASSGQSHIRYRDSAGGNKTFISADHDNDFIKFSNRASNGYFNFFANNATNGAAGEQKVAEFRHDKAQFFQPISGSSITASIDFSDIDNVPVIVSQSSQITLTDTVGNLSGSRIIGDIQASSVEFANVLNKPTLVSSSAQIDIVGNLPAGTVSGSAQIDIIGGLPAGTISSSIQVNADSITNFDTNVVSGLPSGTISGSAQVDLASATGTATNASTASYVDMDDIDFSALAHYDNDAAASAGGVPIGKLYRNGNFIQVRLS